jgi:hypothetical protein
LSSKIEAIKRWDDSASWSTFICFSIPSNTVSPSFVWKMAWALDDCQKMVPLTTKMRFSFLVLNFVLKSMASVISWNHFTLLLTLDALTFSQA